MEVIDSDQRDAVAANRFRSTVRHRLLPFNAVGLDGKAVQVKGDDVAGFMDDRLSTLLLCRSLPNHWTDSNPSTRRASPVTGIRELCDEPRAPPHSNHIRQVAHFVSFEGEFDPFVNLFRLSRTKCELLRHKFLIGSSC